MKTVINKYYDKGVPYEKTNDWYPGNVISMPENYGFPVLMNNLSAYSVLSVEINYTKDGSQKTAIGSVDTFGSFFDWEGL